MKRAGDTRQAPDRGSKDFSILTRTTSLVPGAGSLRAIKTPTQSQNIIKDTFRRCSQSIKNGGEDAPPGTLDQSLIRVLKKLERYEITLDDISFSQIIADEQERDKAIDDLGSIKSKQLKELKV